MKTALSTVRPEPVEGLSFFFPAFTKEGQGFDKLSPNGVDAAVALTGSDRD